MEEEVAVEREPVEIESMLGEKKVCSTTRRWIKGEAIRNAHDISISSGIDAQTLKKIDWIEIAAPKEIIERVEQDEDLMQNLQKVFLPRVLEHWTEDSSIILITETRGVPLMQSFLENASTVLSGLFLCNAARKILTAATHLETARIKGKVSGEIISIREEGAIYIHNDSVWKEVLGMPVEEVQTEEERVRELGMALLSLGTGEVLEGIDISDVHSESEGVQYKILLQVIKISIPCFKEVILSLLGTPYTSYLLEETLAMHFFYPEEQEIEPCRCDAEDYLDEGNSEHIYYKESFGSIRKKTEEIYDKAAGVAVKASTLDKNRFTFQMHFFKSSKKVSFCFNRNADTVDSVMKEMEDEGLAEEGEIELIKAHMENLIIKIDEHTFETQEHTPSNEEKVLLPAAEETAESHNKSQNGSVVYTLPTHTEGSEESSEYSIKEFKDTQQIAEFVSEVAACAKRAKSTADGWAALLKKQDIKTVGDLRMLIEGDWEMLKLSVFASRAMKNILYGESYTPYRENMLGIDEKMKEYSNESTVEDLLSETAQKHGRPELFNIWLQKVKCQDIRTVGELKLLREEDWEKLDLSVFSYRVIRNAIFRLCKC